MTAWSIPMQQYRSKTAAVRPSSLVDGQLFLNQADGVLCWPNAAGVVQTTPLGTTGSGALALSVNPVITAPNITFSTSSSISAGANTQGSLVLTSDINQISTTTANPSGVTLPPALAGRLITIFNNGTNPVNVYPASGAAIDRRGANAAISLPVNSVMYFEAMSATQWCSSYNLAVAQSTTATVVPIASAYTITDANQGQRLEVTGAQTLTIGSLSANFQSCTIVQMDFSSSTFSGSFTGDGGITKTVPVKGSVYTLYRTSDGSVWLHTLGLNPSVTVNDNGVLTAAGGINAASGDVSLTTGNISMTGNAGNANSAWFQSYQSQAGTNLKYIRWGNDGSGNFVVQGVNDAYSVVTVLVSISSTGVLNSTGGFSGPHNGTVGATTPQAGTFTTVAATNSILSSGAGGMGYATGAGGTVAQTTSRTTGVTLNKPTGAITLVSAAGTTTPATFTVTNSSVAVGDIVHLSQASGSNLYNLLVTKVSAGSFNITIATISGGGNATEAPVINFAVIKGASA